MRAPASGEFWSERSRDKDRGSVPCGLESSASEFLFLPKIFDVEFLSLANKSPA